MKKPQTGQCPDCGRKVRLCLKRTSGKRTFYAHVTKPSTRFKTTYCPGSGKVCVEDQKKEQPA